MARDNAPHFHFFPSSHKRHPITPTHSSSRSTMSILSFLLFLLFLSIVLPSTLSSHHNHHHDQNPNTPSPSADTPSNIPLPILLACNATRYPSICHSTLLTNTSLPPKPSPNDLISTTLTTISSFLSTSLTTAQSILSSASSNPNLTNAASNCITFLTLSTHRLAIPTSTSLSATLLHQYDCWSAYKYVNSSSTISNAMAFLNNSIAVTSNALSMLSSLQRYGDDTARWAPPVTERDGYWPNLSGSVAVSDVDRLGVPTKLSINVTVCKERCQFLRLQDALDAAPDYGKEWFVVYVKEGVYEETVRVPWEKTNLVVVGDGIGKTVVTGSLNADTVGVSTFNTATVGVLADGFMARDLTIANTAGPDMHQAVAFRSSGDRTVLDTVELLGHQDTLYAHAMRQFYTRCRISGTVDYVFGNSATFIHNTTLIVLPRQVRPEKGENEALTAQGRTDPAQPTGIVLNKCLVNGSDDYLALYRSNPAVHRVYLGRPWKEYSRTVFADCVLGEIVRPEGWMPWSGDFALKTLYYGEYDSMGPGGDVSRRVTWSSQVPAEHVGVYTLENFIQGDQWIPSSY